MRPVRMEMTAFGPYKDHTVIDFDKLGNGIYAITGPTGAGKTTIFDAMMFALYEQVSGQSADSKKNPVDKNSVRNKNMVRSKYADRRTDTVVRLVFEERGKQYTVTRTIHETPSNLIFGAYLEGTDIPAVKDNTKVTAEIERILGGMDAVRFRQVVMLAQGQFRSFMEAKDDQRKEILEKIFDSRPYREFRERLGRIAARLSEKKREKENDIRLKLRPDVFLLPEDISGEERALYSADLPADILGVNLEKLVQEDEKEIEKVRGQIRESSERLEELNRRIGAAEGENKNYQELQKKKEHLRELEGLHEIMTRKEEQAQETERACHQVWPVYDRMMRLEKETETRRSSLERKEEEILKVRKSLEEAKADQAANKDRRLKVRVLESREEKIRDHLKDFEELAAAEKKADEAGETSKQASGRIRDTEERQKRTLEETADLQKEYGTLKNAELKEFEAERTYREAEEFLEQLSAPKKGIADRALELIKQEEELIHLLETADKARNAAEKAEEDYRGIHRRYLDNYAGKLGAQLEETLSQDGSAACPVCGSVFHKGEEHSFAGLTGETVSEEELQRAQDEKDRLERESKDATGTFSEAGTAVSHSREHLLGELERILPGEGLWQWNKAETVSRIRESIRTAQKGKEKCFLEWKEAKQAVARKKLLEEKLTDLEKQKQTLLQILTAEKERKVKADTSLEHLEAEKIRIREELKGAGMDPYADKNEAQEAQRQLLQEITKLEGIILKADQDLQTAEGKVKELEGQKAEQTRELKAKEQDCREERERFPQILAQNGFGDGEAFQRAAARPGGMDPQAWIRAEREAVTGYRQDLEQTGKRIRDLEKEPPKYTDLAVLEEEREEIRKQQKDLQDQTFEIVKRADSHSSALETLRSVSEELEVIDRAYRRAAALAAAAEGEASAAGRRSFDGYVLGSTFREVLDHASFYLDEMTGGKYSLCHNTEAQGVRRNAAANFVIMVQDALTGKEREIGSLSGGESFQAAMALALGLSDTVQSHVSTVNIDTMFIDEGFGTLDSISLQRMLHVLTNLSGGSRQIGIISHVDELKESIGKFIHVTGSRDDQGSHLRIEV